MKQIHRMTRDELAHLINHGDDDEQIEAAYDELERRERAEETRDWTESDRMAEWSERYEMWRNEY